jgi:predicted ester cyclase
VYGVVRGGRRAEDARRNFRGTGRDLDAFADAQYVVESFVEDGDKFADEWTFTGTNTGPFRLPDGSEVPATGKPVAIRGMELVEVRDGKIVVDNLYYDFMAAVVQLGLVPEGAAA